MTEGFHFQLPTQMGLAASSLALSSAAFVAFGHAPTALVVAYQFLSLTALIVVPFAPTTNVQE